MSPSSDVRTSGRSFGAAGPHDPRPLVPDLVTIVGEAGVGKSRMIDELRELVEERDDLVVWRQGRCLPDGDGIAFWALGEIVKAEAGILESDSPGQAEAKLDRALRGFPSSPTSRYGSGPAWLHSSASNRRARPNARSRSRRGGDRSRRSPAQERPSSCSKICTGRTPGSSSSWSTLPTWSRIPDAPVWTARSELSERHPSWAGGLRNATTLNLAPLSEEASATLVWELLGRRLLPLDVQRPIVERVGGN